MKLKGFKKSDGSIAKIYTDPTLTESDSPADAASVKAKDDLLQQGITNNANYAAGLNTRLSELENGAPSIIAPKVTEWLDANVDPTGSAVTVDSSLTIAGSAADAKKTGDELSNLKSDISDALDTEYKNFGVTYKYVRDSTTGNNIKLCPFPALGTYIFTHSGGATNIVGITGNQSTSIKSISNGTYEVTLTTAYDFLGVYANTDTNGELTVIAKSSQNDRIEGIETDISLMDSVLFGYQFNWISGYYVLYSNGELSSSGRAKYVDFVSCKGIDRIILKTSISGTGASLAFYDADKVYMNAESIKGTGSAQYIVSKIPTGAAYFRCSEYNYDAKELSVITSVEALPNRLQNKKVMFFGDSITWNEDRYVADLLAKSGMTKIHNFAVTGATLTNNQNTVMDGNPSQNSNNTVPNQVQQMLNGTYETPDIVIISASTNDADSHFVYDETQFADSDVDNCDLRNASGAIRWMYEKIMSVYPNAQVYYATPIQSASPTRTFSMLKNKRDVIVESCERMSVYIIDAFYKSGVYSAFEINGSNGKYLIDGLHPNANGAIVIASCYYNGILDVVRN